LWRAENVAKIQKTLLLIQPVELLRVNDRGVSAFLLNDGAKLTHRGEAI
jgi:hypothetical protein